MSMNKFDEVSLRYVKRGSETKTQLERMINEVITEKEYDKARLVVE